MAFDDLLGIGADLVGGAVSSAFNVHESRANRRFQRDISNSAHQREVKDLQAAGLNPILSANKGGASTPSGSAAHVEAPEVSSSYQQSKQTSIQNRVADSSIALQNAQGMQAQSAAKLSEEQANDVKVTRALRLDNLVSDLKTKAQALESAKLEPEQKRQQIELLRKQIQQAEIARQAATLDLSEKKVKKALYGIAEPALQKTVSSAKNAWEHKESIGKKVKNWFVDSWKKSRSSQDVGR